MAPTRVRHIRRWNSRTAPRSRGELDRQAALLAFADRPTGGTLQPAEERGFPARQVEAVPIKRFMRGRPAEKVAPSAAFQVFPAAALSVGERLAMQMVESRPGREQSGLASSLNGSPIRALAGQPARHLHQRQKRGDPRPQSRWQDRSGW